MDSYALPLDSFLTTTPLQAWLDKHWKYVMRNGQSLQSLYNQCCGDYALFFFFFLIDRSRDRSMTTVLNRFQKHDYVLNDHLVRQMLKRLIEKEARWGEVCKCEYEPDTSASRCGVRLLL